MAKKSSVASAAIATSTAAATMATVDLGIGLRHPHYRDILERCPKLDFVEVHCENFYASGGASHQLLSAVAEKYPLSFHGTSMGLASFADIPEFAFKKFSDLCARYTPKFVSDHACFSWGYCHDDEEGAATLHAGDLLPIVFDHAQLARFVENVDRIQNLIKRKILIENLSAYISYGGDEMAETDFLNQLCKQTGCGLILDINNLVVNAHNKNEALIHSANAYIEKIHPEYVEEIHLAGCTPVEKGEIMVDDHSQPVPNSVWESYRFALDRLGPKPTLIEWDTQVPDFDVLLSEVDKAKEIADEVFVLHVAAI